MQEARERGRESERERRQEDKREGLFRGDKFNGVFMSGVCVVECFNVDLHETTQCHSFPAPKFDKSLPLYRYLIFLFPFFFAPLYFVLVSLSLSQLG